MPTYASKVMPLLLFFQKVKSAIMSPVVKFRVSLSKIYLCATHHLLLENVNSSPKIPSKPCEVYLYYNSTHRVTRHFSKEIFLYVATRRFNCLLFGRLN